MQGSSGKAAAVAVCLVCFLCVASALSLRAGSSSSTREPTSKVEDTNVAMEAAEAAAVAGNTSSNATSEPDQEMTALNDKNQYDITTIIPAPANNVGPASLNGTCDGTGTCCKGFKCMYVAGVCCDTGFCCPVGTICARAGPGQPQQCAPGMNGKVLTVPVPYQARDYGEEKRKHLAQIAREHKQAEAAKAAKIAEIRNEEKAKEDKMAASEAQTKATLQQEANKPLPGVDPIKTQTSLTVAASLSAAASSAKEFALQYVAQDAVAAADQEGEARRQLALVKEEMLVKQALNYKRLDQHVQNIQKQRTGMVDNQLNGIERQISALKHSLRIADGNHDKDVAGKRQHALLWARREMKNLELQLKKLKKGHRDDDSQQKTWEKEMARVMRKKKQLDLLDKTLAEQASVDAQLKAADNELHQATTRATKYLVQREGGEAADKRQETLEFDRKAAQRRAELKSKAAERAAKHKKNDDRLRREEMLQLAKDKAFYVLQEKTAKKNRSKKEDKRKQAQRVEMDEKDDDEQRQKNEVLRQRQVKIAQQIKKRALEYDAKAKHLAKVNELQGKAAAKQAELAQKGMEMQTKLKAVQEDAAQAAQAKAAQAEAERAKAEAAQLHAEAAQIEDPTA